MEAQATLEGLVPVERSDSSFFRDGIYDRLDNLQNIYHIFCIAIFFSRFTSSDYNVFSPTNEITQDPIQFSMPPIRSNGVYRLDLAILSLEIKIRKASDPTQFVPSSAKVAIGNNALNTLFARLSICQPLFHF